MTEKYNKIIQELAQATSENDIKKVKRLRNKLSKWQMEYGAYAPITSRNFHKYD